MNSAATKIPDVLLLEPRVFEDSRGSFFESYNERVLAEMGIPGPFVQDNQSFSHKGVVRGLHYQIKQPQGKLIRCLRGEIYDVAVDLRRNSPTFCQLGGRNPKRRQPQNALDSPRIRPRLHGSYRTERKSSTKPPTSGPLSTNEPSSGTTHLCRYPGPTKTSAILSAKDLAGSTLDHAAVYEDWTAPKQHIAALR